MKAVTWCGTRKVSVDNVPDPTILNPRDAIVKITSTCICGSDLHLYDGYIPTMQLGVRPSTGARLHPDEAQGGHPRPRVHGGGRRRRPGRRQVEGEGRRPRD